MFGRVPVLGLLSGDIFTSSSSLSLILYAILFLYQIYDRFIEYTVILYLDGLQRAGVLPENLIYFEYLGKSYF